MKRLTRTTPPTWRFLPWFTAALAGVAAPVLAMVLLPATSSTLALASGPILALGLMGAGLIAAAIAGRLWIGVILALLNGTCLIVLAQALGMPPLLHPASTGLACIIASVSFAARGALFATSLSDRGWLMALFVVAGEAAILLTAAAVPGALPGWLLALLPAQWASLAIQTALSGTGSPASMPALFALAGTAATTLLVAKLWPSRWPYLLMFSTWLSLSALVYYSPSPPHANVVTTIPAAAPLACLDCF